MTQRRGRGRMTQKMRQMKQQERSKRHRGKRTSVAIQAAEPVNDGTIGNRRIYTGLGDPLRRDL